MMLFTFIDGQIKCLILMDLRRSVHKFSELAWQAAKFDEKLTSILEGNSS